MMVNSNGDIKPVNIADVSCSICQQSSATILRKKDGTFICPDCSDSQSETHDLDKYDEVMEMYSILSHDTLLSIIASYQSFKRESVISKLVTICKESFIEGIVTGENSVKQDDVTEWINSETYKKLLELELIKK